MADEDEVADVFSVPDFWKPSKCLGDLDAVSNTPFFSLNPQGFESPRFGWDTSAPVALDGFFKTPKFDSSPKEEIARTETPSLEAPSISSNDGSIAGIELDDLWLQVGDPRPKQPEYKTWDLFDSMVPSNSQPVFITEAGPDAFDALIAMKTDPLNLRNADSCVVDTGALCSALVSLCMGRDSILFSWNDATSCFKPALPNLRVSGCTTDVLRGMLQKCLRCGGTYRRLQSYVQSTYAQQSTPCRVALASAIDRVLRAAQSTVGDRGRQARSILQLQDTAQKLSAILSQFDHFISSLGEDDSDENVLNMIFRRAQSADYGQRFVRDSMREVLRTVSQPWISLMEEWIGTKAEEGVLLAKHDRGRSRGFVKIESETYLDDFGEEMEETDFRLASDKLPDFLPGDVALPMFETGRNLRFIRTSHPDHPLAEQGVIAASKPPRAEWLFEWDSILDLEKRIRKYEDDLSCAVLKYRTGVKPDMKTEPPVSGSMDAYKLHIFGVAENQIEDVILASIKELEQPAADACQEDQLSRVIRDHLSEDTAGTGNMGSDFTPHWSLLPILSFGSIVAAQARVVNRESLRLLFTAHDLREHLKVQREFHLLRNGMFCSRLTHALFDPELETAERHAGVAMDGGIMGLRLSGRDNWPPASSELRLALMGVLSETYQRISDTSAFSRGPRQGDPSRLPGDMSFAVRELSPEDVDKCMDPDCLEALDFLRLSYKAPEAIASIITPIILTQYDRIFKLLLRVLRMLYTVDQLFRDVNSKTSRWKSPNNASLRFSIEAHHFVSTISNYFFDTGIAMPWQAFEKWLNTVEDDLNSVEITPATSLGPDKLREYHSHMLDHMMLSLLLRKRQQPVLKLLEEIFVVILRYAKESRLKARGKLGEDGPESMTSLYRTFRKKVEVFIAVCKGLTEKGGYGTKHGAGGMNHDGKGTKDGAWEETTMAQLLLKLDMFGYYVKGQI
jgi:hypothetical protein